MPRSGILSALMLLLLSLYWNMEVKAQCPVAPPPSPCSGSEPLVAADEIVGNGTTKWYYGAVTTFNSLTMRGGTLIVCGDLTIDKFYMDSGQIIVNPGARFVIGSGIGAGLQLFGKSALYNYGTLEVQRNLSLENGWASPAKPNIIINASTAAVFKMPNQYFVINNANSWFVNRGAAQFWGVITDAQSSAGSVCLGYGSTMQMAIMVNKVANTYSVSSGTPCVYVHQLSEFYGSLTNSSKLFVCLSSGHHSNASCIPFGCTPNAWGAAQVFTNCSGCAALITLPAGFVFFGITEKNNAAILKWEFETTTASFLFYIERSADGKNFYLLDSMQGRQGKEFNYTDVAVVPGKSYYRIRYVDQYSSHTLISKVVSSVSLQAPGSRIYPSPFAHSFFVQTSGAVIQKIIVHDIMGKEIPVNCQQLGYRWQVTPLISVSKQKLIVQIVTNKGVEIEKILQE